MILHRIILLLACLLEIGLITFMRMSPYTGNAHEGILLGISLFIGVYPLVISRYVSPLSPSSNESPKWHWGLLSILVLGGLALSIPGLIAAFKKYPITIEQSDIIPQIEVMVRRFFWEGTSPYTTINDFGYPLFSPYMPFQWGPFAISTAFQFDHRWLAYGLCGLVYIYFAYHLSRQGYYLIFKILLALIPGFFFYQLLEYTPWVFGHTVEPLIMAYYLFLALTILTKSPYWAAAGLILCILSRYALAFWVPMYALVLFFGRSKRNAFLLTAITTAGVLLLYVIPFLSQDWQLLSKGLEYHSGVSERAWTFEGWYTPEGRPGAISWRVGLARYFFDLWPGPPTARLQAIAISQMGLSILAVIILGLLYRRFRKRMETELYLLLSFKIYLTIFYYLYALPFIYMMIVPLAVSQVVLLASFNLPYLLNKDRSTSFIL